MSSPPLSGGRRNSYERLSGPQHARVAPNDVGDHPTTSQAYTGIQVGTDLVSPLSTGRLPINPNIRTYRPGQTVSYTLESPIHATSIEHAGVHPSSGTGSDMDLDGTADTIPPAFAPASESSGPFIQGVRGEFMNPAPRRTSIIQSTVLVSPQQTYTDFSLHATNMQPSSLSESIIPNAWMFARGGGRVSTVGLTNSSFYTPSNHRTSQQNPSPLRTSDIRHPGTFDVTSRQSQPASRPVQGSQIPLNYPRPVSDHRGDQPQGTKADVLVITKFSKFK
jgi:hypothetical protein